MTNIIKITDGKYKGKWKIGPRSAWDHVEIGPFKTKKEAIELLSGIMFQNTLNELRQKSIVN